MEEPELSETIQQQKRAEELKRHVKADNRNKDKEQYSEEKQDFQPPTQTTAEQTKTDDAFRLDSLSK